MVNKKGQEMSVATLVLIVIGIVLLVLLVLGFSMGWQNLWNKINVFGGGSDVSTVVQACQLAASAGDKNAYCFEFKQIKVGNDKVYVNCQSNQVESSLSSRLDCGSAVEANAGNFCGTLSESARNNTKVVYSAGVGAGTIKLCSELVVPTSGTKQ